MLRTIYGFDDLGRKVPVGSYDDGLYSVGGKIFYIDSTSDETVTFYDAQGNVLSNVSVGDKPASYKITSAGTSGKAKYYIVDDTTGFVLYRAWGYDSVDVGSDADGLGAGKTITNSVIQVTDTSEYADSSIFKYLVDTQNAGTGVNNCTDWYIGSKTEVEQLRLSNVLNFREDDCVWSSTSYYLPSLPHPYNNIWSWDVGNNEWMYQPRCNEWSVCYIRSF